MKLIKLVHSWPIRACPVVGTEPMQFLHRLCISFHFGETMPRAHFQELRRKTPCLVRRSPGPRLSGLQGRVSSSWPKLPRFNESDRCMPAGLSRNMTFQHCMDRMHHLLSDGSDSEVQDLRNPCNSIVGLLRDQYREACRLISPVYKRGYVWTLTSYFNFSPILSRPH